MSVSQERLNYPSAEVLAYMEQQAEEFEKLRCLWHSESCPHLVKTHLGQYVWFESGQVLDADEDLDALAIRVCRADEDRPLFIKKVLLEDPNPIVRTPFR